MFQLFERITTLFTKPKEELQQAENMIVPLFFPSKDSEAQLIQLMDKAVSNIRICVYTITNNQIIEKLITLVNSNKLIQIKIITDDVQTMIPFQRALLDNVVEKGKKRVSLNIVYSFSRQNLMHNKYMVLDDTYIVTGSFNWTKKAVVSNRENLVIIKDQATANKFIENFQTLWDQYLDLDKVEHNANQQPAPTPIKKKIIKKTIKRKKKRIDEDEDDFIVSDISDESEFE